MFKRAAENEGGPTAKKVAQDETQVVPRVLPENTITLNFVNRGWEEISPGALYYLPFCQTPTYVFDDAMFQQFNKYRDLWHTMEICAPYAKIIRPVMLQDDVRVQGSTPTDTTAYTQVIYFIKYTPKGQSQYFKLGTTDGTNMNAIKSLTYEVKPKPINKVRQSQLCKMNAFEDFGKLTIHPAQANNTAGFSSQGIVKADTVSGKVKDPYIAPNAQLTQGTMSHLNIFSGNLNPENSEDNFLKSKETITYVRNQNGYSFHNFGEEVSLPITTNIDGVHLFKHESNDFLTPFKHHYKVSDKLTIAYGSEFCWPSRNRPYFSRSNYFDVNTSPITHGKHGFKQLQHHFLCMPPIYKPNDSLLAQRTSIFLEQGLTIKFHMNQATFIPRADDAPMEDDLNAKITHQNDSVILRRNLYPQPVQVVKQEPGPWCPGQSSCKRYHSHKCKRDRHGNALHQAEKCYENTWSDFILYLRTMSHNDMKDMIGYTNNADHIAGMVLLITLGAFQYVGDSTFQTANIQDRWRDALINKKDIYIMLENAETRPKVVQDKYVYWATDTQKPEEQWTLLADQGTDIHPPRYVHLSMTKFMDRFFANSNTICDLPQADPVFDKTCLAFFV